MKTFQIRLLQTLLISTALVSTHGVARAQCTVPPGVAGEQFYNTTHNVMQYCNGSAWVNMGAIGGGGGAGLPAGCDAGDVAQWNGTSWVCGTGGGGGGGGSGGTLTLTDLGNQPWNRVSTTSSVVTGTTGSVTISIAGEGGPELRVDAGAWTTSTMVNNGQNVSVQLTAANAAHTTRTATVTIDGNDFEWTVTTGSGNCVTPWGANVTNGANVWAYNHASAPCGGCNRHRRYCVDGYLDGSWTNQSCSEGSCSPPGDNDEADGDLMWLKALDPDIKEQIMINKRNGQL